MFRSMKCSFPTQIGLMLFVFAVALFSVGIGIGGGTIFVSMLMSVFGYEFKKAAGTSLALIIPISLVGAASHCMLFPPFLFLKYYFIFIPACIIGAILGGKVVLKKQNTGLKLLFSVFLLIISLKMLKIYDFPSLIYSGLQWVSIDERLVLVFTGGIVGMMAVFLGIGCGLLIVPFFVIYLNFNIHDAITLSLTTIFFLSFSGTAVRRRVRPMDISRAKWLFIPALAGSVAGAMVSGHLPALILKKIFSVFLLLMAGNYMIREFWRFARNRAGSGYYMKERKQEL